MTINSEIEDHRLHKNNPQQIQQKLSNDDFGKSKVGKDFEDNGYQFKCCWISPFEFYLSSFSGSIVCHLFEKRFKKRTLPALLLDDL